MDRVRLRAELRQLDSLPTLPWIAVKVMEAALSEDSSPEDVARLIEADQALTLRVLRAASSQSQLVPTPDQSSSKWAIRARG